MSVMLADLVDRFSMRKAPGSDISDRAVCLSVRLRRFGNSRKLSSDAVDIDADKRLIGVRKRLLEGDELRAIVSLDSALQSYVYSRSLPSALKDGIYLLPVDLLEEVDQRLTDFAAQREPLVDAFCAAYPEMIAGAAARLRAVFCAADYPSSDAVRDTFGFDWMYVELGVPSGLKAISRSLWKREAEKQRRLWEDAMAEVREVLRAQMLGLVEHMVDRLSGRTEDGKPRVFRDSLVSNIGDFLNTFEARNLTDDDDMRQLVDDARGLLNGIDPTMLRQSQPVRDVVAEGFRRIRDAMDDMMVTKPSRAIRFEDE